MIIGNVIWTPANW